MFLIFRIFFHMPPDSMCFHEKGFADHLGLRPLEVLRPASFCEPAIEENTIVVLPRREKKSWHLKHQPGP